MKAPEAAKLPLEKNAQGYWSGTFSIPDSSRYLYRLDGEKERPDPASRFQPEGVHGPSALFSPLDHSSVPSNWKSHSLQETILYELHIGTFTAEGTFASAEKKLTYLKELGVTTIEVMPISAFPGKRNWGYDGVSLFAVQESYGGPEAFQSFVQACHHHGIGVCLDVVYNHLGPEGNYLWDYCKEYFTDRYRTPWGSAINFDGPQSDHVRNFFLQNALYWLRDFDIDMLRLDATHAIFDFSSKPFLEELANAVDQLSRQSGRPRFLIAESDANDPRLINSPEKGGFGLHCQWSDDFHHTVHALLTGEREGYYEDFGNPDQLIPAFEDGYVYQGEVSPHRHRRHGRRTDGLPGHRFCVCVQNHDQVGNRALGERFGSLLDLESQKLSLCLLLLAPYVPMLWMGEEFGETNPFLYFVDHGDQDLCRAVSEGRKREFAAFDWSGDVPDPVDESTFLKSKLGWEKLQDSPHNAIVELVKTLIQLRRERLGERATDRFSTRAEMICGGSIFRLSRRVDLGSIIAFANFTQTVQELPVSEIFPNDGVLLYSAENRWAGPIESATIVLKENLTVPLNPRSMLILERITDNAQ